MDFVAHLITIMVDFVAHSIAYTCLLLCKSQKIAVQISLCYSTTCERIVICSIPVRYSATIAAILQY